MQRRNFIKQIGFAASLPFLSGASISARAETPSANGKQKHKILTCNVRVDVPHDATTGDSWAERKELCGDVIKAQQADLIGLQEAQAAHLNYLKSRLPDFDSYALSHAVDYFHPVDAILYRRDRYELISAGGFWLSEKPYIQGSKSWDSANPRLTNWVHLKERSSGKEFRYWNTHLDHKGQKAREKGAAMIVEACSIFPKELPQFLTGDMNAPMQNPAIEILKEGGWTDTYAEVNGPKDPGLTAHGFKAVKETDKRPDGSPRGKIDWIFYRGPVKALSAAVIKDSRNGHYPSDHYFVSAEVEM